MRFYILFLLLSISGYAADDHLFSDENPLLAHHVNVISGHLTLTVQDDLVIAPIPLPLQRTYSSTGALENVSRTQRIAKGCWTLAGGWNLFPHLYPSKLKSWFLTAPASPTSNPSASHLCLHRRCFDAGCA